VKVPDYEALSKGLSRDMSPEAIAHRLDIASELLDLARVLSQAKRAAKTKGDSPADRPEAASRRG
jgi:hypothetical protein